MSDTPYSLPIAEPQQSTSPSSASKWTARIGVLLFLGPLFGAIGTVFGMLQAFHILAKNDSSTPQELSQSISVSLTSTMVGIVIGLLGAVLILVALLVHKNRESWFFGWSVTLATLWSIFLFPLGLLPALPILVTFFTRRSEFQSTGNSS